MFKTIDKKICEAFSDAAVQYDVLTSLHKEIGRDLLKKITAREQCSRILDIGMGPGWLTKRIAFYFPESKIIGTDFAPGMIDLAKNNSEGIQLIVADAGALPFQNDVFDIIVSNLAYQWVADLEHAFQSCYASLNEGGVFCFTAFGRNTLDELFVSLENATEQKMQLPFHRLASQEKITHAMEQSGFQDIQVDYERIKVRFPDMMGLMKWIKNIGANTLRNGTYIGKDLITRANEYYEQHFKDRFGIYTTFEVIWVEAKK